MSQIGEYGMACVSSYKIFETLFLVLTISLGISFLLCQNYIMNTNIGTLDFKKLITMVSYTTQLFLEHKHLVLLSIILNPIFLS
jgi:hypothetical protein